MEKFNDRTDISEVLTKEEQEEIINYCYALTEKLEPGESSDYMDIHFNGFLKVGDEIYVQLEAPYNANTGKTFVLLVKPEIRVIDYWTGNG